MKLIFLLIASLPLFADGSLRVSIVRGAEKGPVTVRVVGIDAVKTIPPDRSEVTFDGLAAGKHELLIEGDEPLKRMKTFALLKPGENRTSIALPGGIVYGRITLGGLPFKTDVTLTHADEAWSTKFTTGDDGMYSSVVWRRGELDLTVSGPGIEPTTVGMITIPEKLTPRVDFDVPDRQVTGRVTTADGAPAGRVVLALEIVTPEVRRVMRRRTDDDGQFLYFGVPAGSHTLRVVSAEGHLRPDPIAFTLGREESLRELAVVLASGHRRTVHVLDHRGEPRAGATLLCVSNGSLRSSATADAKGIALIHTPEKEPAALYALPDEGSLAIIEVKPEDARDAIRIRVPPASSSIDLVAKRTDGTPMPEISFMVRINGEMVPPEVIREMQRHQGVRLLTDEKGQARLPNVPTGFYEFWPVRSDDEIAAILETADILEPPISLNARTGANRVTVRFAKRH